MFNFIIFIMVLIFIGKIGKLVQEHGIKKVAISGMVVAGAWLYFTRSPSKIPKFDYKKYDIANVYHNYDNSSYSVLIRADELINENEMKSYAKYMIIEKVMDFKNPQNTYYFNFYKPTDMDKVYFIGMKYSDVVGGLHIYTNQHREIDFITARENLKKYNKEINWK